MLSVRVVDDGVGYCEDARRGDGLDNLGTRASRLGGTVSITRIDEPHHGTVVSWQVPLEQSMPAEGRASAPGTDARP
jgi:signal transduction histidine kinase